MPVLSGVRGLARMQMPSICVLSKLRTSGERSFGIDVATKNLEMIPFSDVEINVTILGKSAVSLIFPAGLQHRI